MSERVRSILPFPSLVESKSATVTITNATTAVSSSTPSTPGDGAENHPVAFGHSVSTNPTAPTAPPPRARELQRLRRRLFGGGPPRRNFHSHTSPPAAAANDRGDPYHHATDDPHHNHVAATTTTGATPDKSDLSRLDASALLRAGYSAEAIWVVANECLAYHPLTLVFAHRPTQRAFLAEGALTGSVAASPVSVLFVFLALAHCYLRVTLLFNGTYQVSDRAHKRMGAMAFGIFTTIMLLLLLAEIVRAILLRRIRGRVPFIASGVDDTVSNNNNGDAIILNDGVQGSASQKAALGVNPLAVLLRSSAGITLLHNTEPPADPTGGEGDDTTASGSLPRAPPSGTAAPSQATQPPAAATVTTTTTTSPPTPPALSLEANEGALYRLAVAAEVIGAVFVAVQLGIFAVESSLEDHFGCFLVYPLNDVPNDVFTNHTNSYDDSGELNQGAESKIFFCALSVNPALSAAIAYAILVRAPRTPLVGATSGVMIVLSILRALAVFSPSFWMPTGLAVFYVILVASIAFYQVAFRWFVDAAERDAYVERRRTILRAAQLQFELEALRAYASDMGLVVAQRPRHRERTGADKEVAMTAAAAATSVIDSIVNATGRRRSFSISAAAASVSARALAGSLSLRFDPPPLLRHAAGPSTAYDRGPSASATVVARELLATRDFNPRATILSVAFLDYLAFQNRSKPYDAAIATAAVLARIHETLCPSTVSFLTNPSGSDPFAAAEGAFGEPDFIERLGDSLLAVFGLLDMAATEPAAAVHWSQCAALCAARGLTAAAMVDAQLALQRDAVTGLPLLPELCFALHAGPVMGEFPAVSPSTCRYGIWGDGLEAAAAVVRHCKRPLHKVLFTSDVLVVLGEAVSVVMDADAPTLVEVPPRWGSSCSSDGGGPHAAVLAAYASVSLNLFYIPPPPPPVEVAEEEEDPPMSPPNADPPSFDMLLVPELSGVEGADPPSSPHATHDGTLLGGSSPHHHHLVSLGSASTAPYAGSHSVSPQSKEEGTNKNPSTNTNPSINTEIVTQAHNVVILSGVTQAERVIESTTASDVRSTLLLTRKGANASFPAVNENAAAPILHVGAETPASETSSPSTAFPAVPAGHGPERSATSAADASVWFGPPGGSTAAVVHDSTLHAAAMIDAVATEQGRTLQLAFGQWWSFDYQGAEGQRGLSNTTFCCCGPLMHADRLLRPQFFRNPRTEYEFKEHYLALTTQRIPNLALDVIFVSSFPLLLVNLFVERLFWHDLSRGAAAELITFPNPLFITGLVVAPLCFLNTLDGAWARHLRRRKGLIPYEESSAASSTLGPVQWVRCHILHSHSFRFLAGLSALVFFQPATLAINPAFGLPVGLGALLFDPVPTHYVLPTLALRHLLPAVVVFASLYGHVLAIADLGSVIQTIFVTTAALVARLWLDRQHRASFIAVRLSLAYERAVAAQAVTKERVLATDPAARALLHLAAEQQETSQTNSSDNHEPFGDWDDDNGGGQSSDQHEQHDPLPCASNEEEMTSNPLGMVDMTPADRPSPTEVLSLSNRVVASAAAAEARAATRHPPPTESIHAYPAPLGGQRQYAHVQRLSAGGRPGTVVELEFVVLVRIRLDGRPQWPGMGGEGEDDRCREDGDGAAARALIAAAERSCHHARLVGHIDRLLAQQSARRAAAAAVALYSAANRPPAAALVLLEVRGADVLVGCPWGREEYGDSEAAGAGTAAGPHYRGPPQAESRHILAALQFLSDLRAAADEDRLTFTAIATVDDAIAVMRNPIYASYDVHGPGALRSRELLRAVDAPKHHRHCHPPQTPPRAAVVAFPSTIYATESFVAVARLAQGTTTIATQQFHAASGEDEDRADSSCPPRPIRHAIRVLLRAEQGDSEAASIPSSSVPAAVILAPQPGTWAVRGLARTTMYVMNPPD